MTTLDEYGQEITLEKDVECSLCTCGHSSTLPFCDDTHAKINKEQGTSYKSFKIKPKETIVVKVFSKNWKRLYEK